MKNKFVVFEKIEQIGILSLNDPSSLNSMTFDMAYEFKDFISTIQNDPQLSVLLLTGKGKSFCSGGALNSTFKMYNAPPDQCRSNALTFYESFLSIKSLRIPTIAVIRGYVIGAGLCLAMACDMRIADQNSKLAMSFIKLGLNPGMGGTYFLPRLVGTAKALELCLTGQTIDAAEAMRIGLVNHVVDSEQLMDFSLGLAGLIVQNPVVPARLIKEAIYQNLDRDLKSSLSHEAFAQAVCASTEDHKKAVAGFIEKRAAK